MLMMQVLKDEPPSPRRLDNRVSRDLDTICLKCLQKKPHERYQTAAELAAELRRWTKGEPIQARPISSVRRMVRWCRRNPKVAGLAASVAVSLLAGTCVSTYFALDATFHASQHRAQKERAEQSEKDAVDRLWQSYLELGVRSGLGGPTAWDERRCLR